jgi:hypothetical protein
MPEGAPLSTAKSRSTPNAVAKDSICFVLHNTHTPNCTTRMPHHSQNNLKIVKGTREKQYAQTKQILSDGIRSRIFSNCSSSSGSSSSRVRRARAGGKTWNVHLLLLLRVIVLVLVLTIKFLGVDLDFDHGMSFQ